MTRDAAAKLRWRDVAAAVIAAGAWSCLYLLPGVVGSISISPTIRFLILPLVIGIGLASVLGGTWPEKLAYMFGMPVLPVLFFGISFSAGTDPEGSALAWMLAGLPLLPYLLAAGITIALLELRKKDTSHQK
jgi:hypothetical protein